MFNPALNPMKFINYFSAGVAFKLAYRVLCAAIKAVYDYITSSYIDDLSPTELQRRLEKIRLNAKERDRRAQRYCANAFAYFTTVTEADLMNIGTRNGQYVPANQAISLPTTPTKLRLSPDFPHVRNPNPN